MSPSSQTAARRVAPTPGQQGMARLASAAPAPWGPAKQPPPALPPLGSAAISTRVMAPTVAPAPSATRACAQVSPSPKGQVLTTSAVSRPECFTAVCLFGTMCTGSQLQTTFHIDMLVPTIHTCLFRLLLVCLYKPTAIHDTARCTARQSGVGCPPFDSCLATCCRHEHHLLPWVGLQLSNQDLHPVQSWGDVSWRHLCMPALPRRAVLPGCCGCRHTLCSWHHCCNNRLGHLFCLPWWLCCCCWVLRLHTVQGRHVCISGWCCVSGMCGWLIFS